MSGRRAEVGCPVPAMSAADGIEDCASACFSGQVPPLPVLLVAGEGWIERGVQVAAQLITVRILVQGLGTPGYGVFVSLPASTAGCC